MRWRVGFATVVAIAGGPARAQGLSCESTAGEVCDASGCQQTRIFEIRRYPAEAHFQLIVRSADPQQPSILLNARDDLLAEHAALDTSTWNTSFQSAPAKLPVSLALGFAYQASNLTISSYEACKALSRIQNAVGPVLLDNRLVVTWDAGQAQCTSRVVCFP
jgi:hypothetical protein